jgi:uncharacterized protein (TIGR00369 family)
MELAFLPASPFASHLGLELAALGDDRAELRLPWRPEHATTGDVVHGGAIAALLDTAGMAAAWADEDDEPRAGGATIALSVNHSVHRGHSLCFVEVAVHT